MADSSDPLASVNGNHNDDTRAASMTPQLDMDVPPIDTTGRSTRFVRFNAAWDLAARRAHKWSYEGFEQCFPLITLQIPERMQQIHAESVGSLDVESPLIKSGRALMYKYNVPDGIDSFQEVFNEARRRQGLPPEEKEEIEPFKDAWRPVIDPRAAIRARTMPHLVEERDRLLTELRKIEARTEKLDRVMVDNVARQQKARETSLELVEGLQKTTALYSEVPIDTYEQWSLEQDEMGNI